MVIMKQINPIPVDKSSAPKVAMPIDNQGEKLPAKVVLIVYIILIVMGLGTGYLLAGKKGVLSTSGKAINTGKVVGISDSQTFKDSAVGVIQVGGIDGEGTHSLIREGGPSQTVVLISSVVDLDQYVGKTVKVWGQTLSAQKAAWLMDVGKIEIQ